MFTQDGDIKFFYDGNKPADIDLGSNGYDLIRDPGFETSVLISLFTDARASAEDKLPDKESTRRGWWGDTLTDTPIGSKIWLLERSKNSAETRTLLEQYTRDSLEWMITDGIADSIETESVRNGIYRADVAVKITRIDNANVFFKWFLNWDKQIFGGF